MKAKYIKKMIPIEFRADFTPPEIFDEDECCEKDCPFFLQDDNYGRAYCEFPNSDEDANVRCPVQNYF